MSAAHRSSLLALSLAACVARPEASPSPDPLRAACELAPVAREVAADLKSAADAAILGDNTAMSKAANEARAHGNQIITALSNTSTQPSTRQLETELR